MRNIIDCVLARLRDLVEDATAVSTPEEPFALANVEVATPADHAEQIRVHHLARHARQVHALRGTRRPRLGIDGRGRHHDLADQLLARAGLAGDVDRQARAQRVHLRSLVGPTDRRLPCLAPHVRRCRRDPCVLVHGGEHTRSPERIAAEQIELTSARPQRREVLAQPLRMRIRARQVVAGFASDAPHGQREHRHKLDRIELHEERSQGTSCSARTANCSFSRSSADRGSNGASTYAVPAVPRRPGALESRSPRLSHTVRACDGRRKRVIINVRGS